MSDAEKILIKSLISSHFPSHGTSEKKNKSFKKERKK
jgi:hypothetical protein